MTIWLLATMIVMAYMGVVFHLSMRHMEKELGILRDEINECLAKHEFEDTNPEEDVT